MKTIGLLLMIPAGLSMFSYIFWVLALALRESYDDKDYASIGIAVAGVLFIAGLLLFKLGGK